MPRVALPPIALVALAGLGDAAGAHSVSFFLLVLAVPAAAIAALAALDSSFSRDGGTRALAHAWLHGLSLVFLLVATAARAPAHGEVPRVAVSAFIACLLVFAVQGVVAAAPNIRTRREVAPEPRTAESR